MIILYFALIRNIGTVQNLSPAKKNSPPEAGSRGAVISVFCRIGSAYASRLGSPCFVYIPDRSVGVNQHTGYTRTPRLRRGVLISEQLFNADGTERGRNRQNLIRTQSPKDHPASGGEFFCARIRICSVVILRINSKYSIIRRYETALC